MVIPKIGMRVKINDYGIRAIAGLQSVAEAEASKEMVITEFTRVPCDDAELYDIEVDGPMSIYMLTNHCVDEIE